MTSTRWSTGFWTCKIITVGQIAKPLAETLDVEAQTPLRAALALAREKNLSRLPVWEMRDGTAPHRRACWTLVRWCIARIWTWRSRSSAFMTPAVFVNEGIRLEVALRLMQRAGQRMAIVLSRDARKSAS